MHASDRKEFLEAYHKIHDALVRFCTVKSRGIMDAKDLVHDVLIIGLENYPKLKNKDALLAFLFTSANNICRNKIRRKKFVGAYHQGQAENMRDASVSIEEMIDASILYDALDELPEVQKEAVVLFEISDLPIKEIMLIQDAKESAVKQRIKRGREKLVHILREKDYRKPALVAALMYAVNANATSKLDVLFTHAKSQKLAVNLMDATEIIQTFGLTGKAALAKGVITSSQKLLVAVAGSIVVCAGVLFFTNKEKAVGHTGYESNLPAENVPFEEVASIPMYHEIDTKQSSSHSIDHRQKVKKIISKPSLIQSPSLIPSFEIEKPEMVMPAKKNRSTVVLGSGDTYNTANVNLIKINKLGEQIILKTWDKEEVSIKSDHVFEGKSDEDNTILRENLSHYATMVDGVLTLSENTCTRNDQYTSFGKRKFGTITFENGESAKYRKIERKYVITIPKRMALEVNVDYCTMSIPSLTSTTTLQLFHSTLNGANFDGDLTCNAKYSTVNVGNFENGSVELFHSTFNFAKAKDIQLNAKYSKLNAAKANDLNGDAFHSDVVINELAGNVKGDFKYSNFTTTSKLSSLTISSFQSNFYLNEVNELRGNLKYTNLKVDYVKELKLAESFQGDYSFGAVDVLEVESSRYTDYNIGALHQSAKMSSFQDNVEIKQTSDNIQLLDFDGKYTLYDIQLNENVSYKFSFEGNYCPLDYGTLPLSIQEKEQVNNLKTIKGILNQSEQNTVPLSFECFQGEVDLK
jgi:RNA polymerase sigma-70 factor (ECF subfamily)